MAGALHRPGARPPAAADCHGGPPRRPRVPREDPQDQRWRGRMRLTRIEAEAAVLDAQRRALATLLVDGQVLPALLLVPPPDAPTKNPARISLAGGVASDRAKDMSMATVRMFAHAAGVAGAITVMEAWVAKPSPGIAGDMPGLAHILPPSQDPQRGEAIIVAWEFR